MFYAVIFAMRSQAASELPVLGDHTLGSIPQKDFNEVRRKHIPQTWRPEELAHV